MSSKVRFFFFFFHYTIFVAKWLELLIAYIFLSPHIVFEIDVTSIHDRWDRVLGNHDMM